MKKVYHGAGWAAKIWNRKNVMRFFIDSKPHSEMNGDGLKYKTTPTYAEFERKLEDLYLVYYFIPRSENSIYVATCWDRYFDDFVASEQNLKVIAQTWELFTQLLINGLEKRYSEGSLVKLEDFDTGEEKWFLVSVSGNLDFTSEESVFTPRTDEVTALVVEKSFALFAELLKKEPSTSSEIKSTVWNFIKNVTVNALEIYLAGEVLSDGGLFETETSFDKPPTFAYFEDFAKK